MDTREGCYSGAVVENIPGICQLEPEQEECLVQILNGGDVVALTPNRFWEKLHLSTITDRQLETGQYLLSFSVLEYCRVML